MLLAFSFVALDAILHYTRDDLEMLQFAEAVISRSLHPSSLLRGDELLRDVYRPGARNIEYLPWINMYPDVVRLEVTKYACRVGIYSLNPSPPLSPDEYLDSLSVGFAEGAHHPTVFIGTVAWILVSRFHSFLSGDKFWHSYWADLLEEDFMETPSLPEPTDPLDLRLRNDLKQHYLDQNKTCCGERFTWEEHHWTIYSAILRFVKSKNPDPRFKGCPECHQIYMDVMSPSRAYSRTNYIVEVPGLHDSESLAPSAVLPLADAIPAPGPRYPGISMPPPSPAGEWYLPRAHQWYRDVLIRFPKHVFVRTSWVLWSYILETFLISQSVSNVFTMIPSILEVTHLYTSASFAIKMQAGVKPWFVLCHLRDPMIC